MSRLDTIRRELRAYLAELDAERERVHAFLSGIGPVLDGEPISNDQAVSDPVMRLNPLATRVEQKSNNSDTAALRAMQRRPDIRVWGTPALLAALLEDGWTTGSRNQLNAASAILSRLARSGQLERHGRGLYALPRPTNAETPAPTGVSVVPAPTEEGRTADVESFGDRNDHLARWNDSHGRGTPSVVEG